MPAPTMRTFMVSSPSSSRAPERGDYLSLSWLYHFSRVETSVMETIIVE
jgi:hypothetical protein